MIRASGQTSGAAAEYYNRSLQLNPGNRNARTMLRRLSLQPIDDQVCLVMHVRVPCRT